MPYPVRRAAYDKLERACRNLSVAMFNQWKQKRTIWQFAVNRIKLLVTVNVWNDLTGQNQSRFVRNITELQAQVEAGTAPKEMFVNLKTDPAKMRRWEDCIVAWMNDLGALSGPSAPGAERQSPIQEPRPMLTGLEPNLQTLNAMSLGLLSQEDLQILNARKASLLQQMSYRWPTWTEQARQEATEVIRLQIRYALQLKALGHIMSYVNTAPVAELVEVFMPWVNAIGNLQGALPEDRQNVTCLLQLLVFDSTLYWYIRSPEVHGVFLQVLREVGQALLLARQKRESLMDIAEAMPRDFVAIERRVNEHIAVRDKILIILLSLAETPAS